MHIIGSSERYIKPGDRISFLIKHKGYTLKHSAELCGISPQSISHAIKTSSFRASTLHSIAEGFKCSTDWIMGRHPDQLRQAYLCFRPMCGMHALWSVQRLNQPESEASLCCDEHMSYYMARDHQSTVLPIHLWAKRQKEKTTA